MKFPTKLYGSVWHSTSIERFSKIKADGKIKANPDLPNSERFGTKLGPKYYPFVRSIGGVSVFDFRNFDVDTYNHKFSVSNWALFVPCRSGWTETVWIEVDIQQLTNTFLSGQEIRELWKNTNSSRKFITIIEGAVIGAIPSTAFKQVLLYQSCSEQFLKIT